MTSPKELKYTGNATIPITSHLRIVKPGEDAPEGIWPVFRIMVSCNINTYTHTHTHTTCLSAFHEFSNTFHFLFPFLYHNRMKMGLFEMEAMMAIIMNQLLQKRIFHQTMFLVTTLIIQILLNFEKH